jgi:ribosomal protein S18 acetylase RimI-like enzyme
MTITIRDARPADAAIIIAFNAALARETEGKTLYPRLIEPGVHTLLADPLKGRYFIAERGGQVVGQTMVTYEWSDWRNGTFWWIQSVYVAPAHRRSGVFRALHAHLLALAQSDPTVCGIRLYVEHHNAHALRTYLALGMVDSGYALLEQDFRAPARPPAGA